MASALKADVSKSNSTAPKTESDPSYKSNVPPTENNISSKGGSTEGIGNTGNIYADGNSSNRNTGSYVSDNIGGANSTGAGSGSVPKTTPDIILYDGVEMTSGKALDAAERFLGEGYIDMGNGRFVSADGGAQVRMADPDILGHHAGGPHMNFELIEPILNRPKRFDTIMNIHVFLTD